MKLKSIGSLTLLCASAFTQAQFTSSGVSLLSNLDLAFFGASSGNDCWGYVSPSGREYAIVGLSNQCAFIEVTDPTHPHLVTSIAHNAGLWADMMTYGQYCYLGSESVGVGIQVMDMGQIDNGVVTLVYTVPSPGRNHDLSVDSVGGYLYTCGSRDGTGTTTCFSLANPAHPVQVGPNSFTSNYQHDGLPVTYTSGPLAGKTYWFGFSENRGVDVYDFTSKTAPLFKRRVTYPNMGYCHQGWISADKKYLYVDDELDEQNFGNQTRTLIFNVEDPLTAFYVGAFTTPIAAIDHNQFWSDGFIFQANYKSGLRIQDVENPIAPLTAGFFDTYPGTDSQGFNGAWGCYPYLPSGNVIISDLDRGFFIVDPSAALTRTKSVTSYLISEGAQTGGSMSSLSASDNNRMVISQRGTNPRSEKEPTSLSAEFSGSAFDFSPQKIAIAIESAAIPSGTTQLVQLYNWTSGQFETVGGQKIDNADTALTVQAKGVISRFVNQTTKGIKARVLWQAEANPLGSAVSVDRLQFLVTR